MDRVKKTFLALSIALLTVGHGFSQVFLKIRPHLPNYIHIPITRTNQYWVEEDWQTHGTTYLFVDGHWVQPPYEGMVWVPGHWKLTWHGLLWRDGHWR